MSFGKRIKYLRKAKGLTQEEVARRAGMSLKGMSDIERGVIPDPHLSSLTKIAERGLGIDVSELLSMQLVEMKGFAISDEKRERIRKQIEAEVEAAKKDEVSTEETAEKIMDELIEALT